MDQQNVDVIPHRISGEERHHLLDNETDSQGFFRAFVNYFKGEVDETSHQSGCGLLKELDFPLPAPSALTEFRVIPTMKQHKHQLCAFIYSKNVRVGGQFGIRVKLKENVFLVKCHFEPMVKHQRRAENGLYMGATLATAYGLKLGDRVTISAVEENFAACKGTLKVREDGRRLLAKLCQPFLLADATDICHPNLKFSVSGGDFCGNWNNNNSSEKLLLDSDISEDEET